MSAAEAVSLCVRNVAADYVSAAAQRVLLRNVVAIPSFQTAHFRRRVPGLLAVGRRVRGPEEAVLPLGVRRGRRSRAASELGRTIDYAAHDVVRKDGDS
jgi:hypothetical protein